MELLINLVAVFLAGVMMADPFALMVVIILGVVGILVVCTAGYLAVTSRFAFRAAVCIALMIGAAASADTVLQSAVPVTSAAAQNADQWSDFYPDYNYPAYAEYYEYDWVECYSYGIQDPDSPVFDQTNEVASNLCKPAPVEE